MARQVSRHSSMVSKLLALPWQPPKMKSLQVPTALSKWKRRSLALQEPLWTGRVHSDCRGLPNLPDRGDGKEKLHMSIFVTRGIEEIKQEVVSTCHMMWIVIDASKWKKKIKQC